MQKNDAACCNASQVVKLKVHLLQHLLVLQLLYNVSTNATWKVMSCGKINLSRDKHCPLTWCFNLSRDITWMLGHNHLSLRQSTTYPSTTSKPYSLSYLEHSSNWYVSIHSLKVYYKICHEDIWDSPIIKTPSQITCGKWRQTGVRFYPFLYEAFLYPHLLPGGLSQQPLSPWTWNYVGVLETCLKVLQMLKLLI